MSRAPANSWSSQLQRGTGPTILLIVTFASVYLPSKAQGKDSRPSWSYQGRTQRNQYIRLAAAAWCCFLCAETIPDAHSAQLSLIGMAARIGGGGGGGILASISEAFMYKIGEPPRTCPCEPYVKSEGPLGGWIPCVPRVSLLGTATSHLCIGWLTCLFARP